MEFECDLLTQDCPIGEKCTPWSYDGGMAWNGTRCSPVVAMPGAPGDPCTVEGSPWSGLDDCAGGSMCWDADPRTGMGECVAQCDQALMPDPACPMGTSCMPIFTRVDPPSTAGVCLPE